MSSEKLEIFDKYIIAHKDGTPLKGKKYFVLRLDSDDAEEAARVNAAMAAYKGEPTKKEKDLIAALERVLETATKGEEDPKSGAFTFAGDCCTHIRYECEDALYAPHAD